MTTNPPHTLLRRREVQSRTGLSRSAIYADKAFPRSIRIGARAVAWVESEVAGWIAERIAVSRQPAANQPAANEASYGASPAAHQVIPRGRKSAKGSLPVGC